MYASFTSKTGGTQIICAIIYFYSLTSNLTHLVETYRLVVITISLIGTDIAVSESDPVDATSATTIRLPVTGSDENVWFTSYNDSKLFNGKKDWNVTGEVEQSSKSYFLFSLVSTVCYNPTHL